MQRATLEDGDDNILDFIVERTGATCTMTNLIIADHLGTPRLLVRTSDGVVVHELDVDEWGRVLRDFATTERRSGSTRSGSRAGSGIEAPAALGGGVAGIAANGAAQVVRSGFTGQPVDGLEVIFSGVGGAVGGGLGDKLRPLFTGGGLADDLARETAGFLLSDAPIRAAQTGVQCGTQR